MKKALLDQVLDKAIEEALAGLTVRAKAMVEEALGVALEARLKALLGEEVPAILTLTPEAPIRAKAKAQATSETILANGEVQEGAKAPRKRKAKTQATSQSQEDLESILEGVRVALQKYSGIATPKGKAYPDVLFRRVKKVLEHARENGHHNLALLARSALAHIATNPRDVAMASWQYLAGKLGLPVPVAQGE